MSNYINTNAVVGVTAACSFILLGNAITQSFMGVPALLVDFPRPLATNKEEYAAASKKLGRQWPVFWQMGNVFFRPMSTLGIFTYSYAAIATLRAASSPLLSDFGVSTPQSTTWKLYAISAACHLITVVHSAINMQPINARIDALRGQDNQGNGSVSNGKVQVGGESAQEGLAEFWARKWIRLNSVRIVMPAIAGSMAMWGLVRGASK
ncbi:hypothetical protein V8F33_007902 [Rhypophila sp. PSN 637]